MGEIVHLDITLEGNEFNIRVESASEILKSLPTENIIYYAFSKHLGDYIHKTTASSHADLGKEEIINFHDISLEDAHMYDGIHADAIVRIVYVFKEQVKGEYLTEIVKYTNDVFVNLDYLELSYLSLIISVEVGFEIIGVNSEDLFIVDIGCLSKIYMLKIKVSLIECKLSKVYIHPYIRLNIRNSEIGLIGEHVLEPSLDIISFNTKTAIDMNVFNTHASKVFLCVSTSLIMTDRNKPWYLVQDKDSSNLNEKAYHYFKIREFAEEINLIASHMSLCSTNIYKEFNVDDLQEICMDRDSTVLYMNYCTKLARVYKGRGKYKRKKYNVLMNYLQYYLKNNESQNKSSVTPNWAIRMLQDKEMQYCAAYVGLVRIEDIEEYYPLNLSLGVTIGDIPLGCGLVDLCEKLQSY